MFALSLVQQSKIPYFFHQNLLACVFRPDHLLVLLRFTSAVDRGFEPRSSLEPSKVKGEDYKNVNTAFLSGQCVYIWVKVELTTKDIGRSHPIGEVRNGKISIISRFLTYRQRHMVFSHKKKLKGHPDSLRISPRSFVGAFTLLKRRLVRLEYCSCSSILEPSLLILFVRWFIVWFCCCITVVMSSQTVSTSPSEGETVVKLSDVVCAVINNPQFVDAIILMVLDKVLYQILCLQSSNHW
jgi:hypothetical protein